MKETNRKLPQIMYNAIERLKLCFGGTDNKSLGEKYFEIKKEYPDMTHEDISDSIDAYINYW